MGTESYEVFMATFPDTEGASGAVSTLEDMAKQGSIDIVDAAVITRAEDGKTSVQQHSLPSIKKWTKRGAIIGGVVGVIFPPSLIGGALVGAGIGAGAAKIGKEALKSDELEQAASELEPGTSAFVAVVEDKWVQEVTNAMAGYSKLAEQALDADSAARLGIMADEESGAVAMSGDAFEVDPETGEAAAASFDVVSDPESGITAASGSAAAIDPSEGTVEAAAFEAVEVDATEDTDEEKK
ncbi:MAG: DUF1269 domain-containing protein [Acidimicrobiia bacterium]